MDGDGLIISLNYRYSSTGDRNGYKLFKKMFEKPTSIEYTINHAGKRRRASAAWTLTELIVENNKQNT